MDRGWMEEWEQDGITGSKLTGVIQQAPTWWGILMEEHEKLELL